MEVAGVVLVGVVVLVVQEGLVVAVRVEVAVAERVPVRAIRMEVLAAQVVAPAQVVVDQDLAVAGLVAVVVLQAQVERAPG
jgi:hypothetical protein